jgi:hypothetical protein
VKEGYGNYQPREILKIQRIGYGGVCRDKRLGRKQGFFV